ncbi:DUF397 domain-containing protein [Streptomyces sp. NPDC002851]
MNSELAWFKSSYSDTSGGACLEVALNAPADTTHIRDSKNPTGPHLTVPAPAWAAFLGIVK